MNSKNQEPTGKIIREPMTGKDCGNVAEFRDAAQRYATAEEPRDREASLERLSAQWASLRDRANAVGHLSPRFPAIEQVKELLAASIRDEDSKKRSDASDALVTLFERVTRGIEAAGSPSEPGAPWRPDQPPLAKEDQEKRLKEVSRQTNRTARSMADAIRKVISARRENGVPLYASFSNQIQATYAAAATDYAQGFFPAAPSQPGQSKRTAPWGFFEVRSDAAPHEALERFAVSPPLPVWGELLESRSIAVRFAPLHQPAATAVGADSTTGRNDANP